MQHQIPLDPSSQPGQHMVDAVQACVHCGFCLPTCPTYQVLEHESDSPRGRILLMKHVLEGRMVVDDALHHIDNCLGCLACETACPSGVKYRELISLFRERSESQRTRPLAERLRRWMVLHSLPYPNRFRWATRLGRMAVPFKRILPKSLRAMLELLPARLPSSAPLPAHTSARGPQRARVAMLAGCVQQAIEPEIGHATIDVLARNGVEVVVPPEQACCGALAWHVGDADAARTSARTNLQVFPDDVDAIITNAAGCGSGMHEYPIMFAGTPWHQPACELAGRVRDVAEFLGRLGVTRPPPLAEPLRLVYHDACHLSHGQSVRSSPRQLLSTIENLQVLDLRDDETCCGSAGTYNLDQPDVAAELGRRKAKKIAELQPDLVAMGNIGCIVQLRTHLSELPNPPRVLHTIQVLQLAYQGRLGKT